MIAAEHDFEMTQGSTFDPTLRYSTGTWTKVPITGITKSGRAVVTAAGHGLTGAWTGYIVGVVGMDMVNHKSKDLDIPERAYDISSVLSSSTLQLEVDTSRFGAYTSGGELLYRTPYNLTGLTARMQLRSSVDSDTIIKSLTTENGGITLGGTAGTIALLISATDTAAFTFTKCVYDLELVSGSTVIPIMRGTITLVKEVTR